MQNTLHLIRLDYLSCILTIVGTVLIGKKLWQGWVVAAVNSAVVCVIGFRTAQFGFVPANLLCIALYTRRYRTALDRSGGQESGAECRLRPKRAASSCWCILWIAL